MERFDMVNFQPTALLTAIMTTVIIAFLHSLPNNRPMFATKSFLFGPQKALWRIVSHPRSKAFTTTEYLVGFPGRVKCFFALKTDTIWPCSSRWWADSMFGFIIPVTLEGTEGILDAMRWMEDSVTRLTYRIRDWCSGHGAILST